MIHIMPCGAALTNMMQGLMKNQHILHHNQKVKLFCPSIISMSLIKRFPPVIYKKNICVQYIYPALD